MPKLVGSTTHGTRPDVVAQVRRLIRDQQRERHQPRGAAPARSPRSDARAFDDLRPDARRRRCRGRADAGGRLAIAGDGDPRGDTDGSSRRRSPLESRDAGRLQRRRSLLAACDLNPAPWTLTPDMDLGLRDKIALITGSSRGLGLASAKSLAAEGCRVVLTARGAEQLARAAEEVAAVATGQRPVQRCARTLTTADGIARAVDAAVTTFGGLDVLVNNMGLARGAGLLDTTDAEWQEAFDQTLYPAIRASKLAVPLMRKRGGGVIVMITSIWGRESGGRMTYNVTKAAETSLAKALAQQFARDNVRVSQRRARIDPVPGRLVAQTPAGRPRRHLRLRPPRAAVRPVRPRRGSRRRRRVSRVSARELDQRLVRRRGRLPVEVQLLGDALPDSSRDGRGHPIAGRPPLRAVAADSAVWQRPLPHGALRLRPGPPASATRSARSSRRASRARSASCRRSRRS